MKFKKGIETNGPAVVVVLSPCILLWHIKPDEANTVSRLAIDSCFWPLYEVINGRYVLNYDPDKRKKPIEEFMKPQEGTNICSNQRTGILLISFRRG